MEYDNGAVILLIVLIAIAFLLTIFKVVQFFIVFNREKRYFKIEMRRASDYDEYRYWRRELRCLYLCLIPFVTERNVMRLYHRLYHRGKREKQPDSVLHILAPSFIGLCVCAACLYGASWAWFTAGVGTGTAAIRSATFGIEEVSITSEDSQPVSPQPDKTGNYIIENLNSGTYTLSFKASGSNTSSKGYCRITVTRNGDTAGTLYCTEEIGKGICTVKIITEEAVTLKIEPVWGSAAATVVNGTITVAKENSGTFAISENALPTVPPSDGNKTPAEVGDTKIKQADGASAAAEPESSAAEDSTPPNEENNDAG